MSSTFLTSASHMQFDEQTISVDSSNGSNINNRLKNPSLLISPVASGRTTQSNGASIPRSSPRKLSVKSRRFDTGTNPNVGRNSFSSISPSPKPSPRYAQDEVFEDVGPFGSYIPSSPSYKRDITPVSDPENVPNDASQSAWNQSTDSERSKRQWILFDRATGKEHKRKLTFRATLFIAKISATLNLQEPCAGPSAVLPWLYIGDARDAQDIYLLRDKLRITHVLNAAGSCPKHHEDKFIYLHLPLMDTDLQDLSKAFSLAATFITDAKISGGRVFVHCMAGISRSVAIVLAYLMQRGSDFIRDGEDLTLDEAFSLVRYKRPQALPNIGFRKQLALYEVKVRGKSSILKRIGRFPWKGDQFNALMEQLSDSQDLHRKHKQYEELQRKEELRKHFAENASTEEQENPPVFHPSRSRDSRTLSSSSSTFEPTAFSTVPPIYTHPRPTDAFEASNNTAAAAGIADSTTRVSAVGQPTPRRIEVRASRRNIPLSPTRPGNAQGPHKRPSFGFAPDTPYSQSSSGSQRNPVVYPASPISFFSVSPSPSSSRYSGSPRTDRSSRKSSLYSASSFSSSALSQTSDFSHGFSWSYSDPAAVSASSLGIRF